MEYYLAAYAFIAVATFLGIFDKGTMPWNRFTFANFAQTTFWAVMWPLFLVTLLISRLAN